ncbi:hypothetical protein CI610_00483 [invertebrate metagenome]|uniref:DUF5615 domain-containing protein n=1 Tax=invertebrate metagenome TaxID=1711999 RepID=A0A2H9TB92_9ZZZZ
MLLIDENLSPRLVARTDSCFPGSLHVLHVGLDNSPDIALWTFAKAHNLAIVTKDKDFLSMFEELGYPPKLIYMTIGNAKVSVIEKALVESKPIIDNFLKDTTEGLLRL